MLTNGIVEQCLDRIKTFNFFRCGDNARAFIRFVSMYFILG